MRSFSRLVIFGALAACSGASGSPEINDGPDASVHAGGSSSTSSVGGASSGASSSSGSSGSSTGGSGSGSSGGSSGGSGGGSGTTGSGSADASSGAASADGSATASCLGASLLSDLGKTKLMVGGMVADATAASTPMDLRYIYLSGGLFDGASACTACNTGCSSKGVSCNNESGGGCAWWGCWQYDRDPPGDTARDLVEAGTRTAPPQTAMFTYYEILNTSGASEGASEVAAANDASLMERYFADWRFLLQQVGQNVAILQIEPDFWGFAQQGNSNAHSIPAAVASANSTDCGGVENSIAGMGQCMVSMVRKYAPHARVGLNASAWGTNIDVLGNIDPTLDVAGEAQKLATFLLACGVNDADFVTIETSDRDSGYYASMGRDTVWDPTNATLPNFTQALAWAKALTEALNKPALYWQTPFGNASQNNTTNHWTDNRVDYFFGHMADLARSHIVGVAYGAGATGMTTAESDGGNFIAKARAYAASGGQALCE